MLTDKRRNLAALLIWAVIGTLTFVSILGNYSTVIDAFQIELGITIFDRGYTQLEIPPLGRVRAKTHLPPLMLKVRLDNINLQQIQEMLNHTQDESYLGELRKSARRKVEIFLLRLLLLAFVGGFAGPFFFGERNRKRLLAAGLIGMFLIGILLVFAYVSYEPLAFMNPEFEGILKAAPWMFGLIEETLFNVNTLGEQLALVADSVNNLFVQVQRLEPLGTAEGELKVAHISDLHNNPAGMDFARQVIDAFGAHIVIDTGDITDFGTQIEAELASPIEAFGIPYLFIPGNHDSPDVINRLKTIPNVTVLEEGIVTVLGLRIAGIADPSSEDNGMVVAPDYILDQYGERLQELVFGADEPVHIAAVHHPRIATWLINDVPLILTGHTHQFYIRERGESVMINAGTSGAAGIRGLQTGKETPYSLVLLHFSYREDGQVYLKAADTIHVFQLQSGFSLERRLFSSAGMQKEEEILEAPGDGADNGSEDTPEEQKDQE